MLHIVTGHDRSTAHTHDTVAEARECEDMATAYDMEPPSCPICDAWGCGGARGSGCDRYERGSLQASWEEDQERAREAAMGGRFPY